MTAREWIAGYGGNEILLAEGFDSAILGLAEGWFPAERGGIVHAQVVAYDWQGCIGILVARGMTEKEAAHWMDFELCTAYAGDGTPVFVRKVP